MVIGEPGLSGSWDISDSIQHLPLKEKNPGIYIGDYRVGSGDRVSSGHLAARLISKSGLESRWIDVLGSVTLGKPTLLPAKISEDTVLNHEKSPYVIKDALIIQPGVTLKIEPGTVIWSQRFGIIAKGTIHARGTFEKPVLFFGMGSSKWKGILLAKSSGENLFSLCEISNAQYGLRGIDSKVNIDRSSFQENEWGVVLDGGAAKIRKSLIQTSGITGLSVRNGNLTLTGSIVSENKGGGILLHTPDVFIENNNISNNGKWELKVIEGQRDILVQNNWWGNETPDQNSIIGPVIIEPVLKKPIDLPKL